MPKLKQPIPLQKLAFDHVVECTVCHCHALSIKGLLTELRESVAVIKQRVSDNVPGVIFMEFCRRFLNKFYSIGCRHMLDKRPDSHNSAALEMIMDVQFPGLICEGAILYYLNPVDAHRIQGLKTLDWSELQYRSPVSRGLENYRLQDLTTFIFPSFCTDLHLEIIGARCLKLEVLRIQVSKKVTDRGLRALRPCSELRIINLRDCRVSDDGVNELLNVHKKLEQFNSSEFDTIGEKSFDVLSRPISLVCPSVKRFSLKSYSVANAHLHAVVALFPNLTHLEFCCPFIGDLCILKDLKNLTGLEFDQASGGFTMKNLKDLLTSVGGNISLLALDSDIYVTQNDLIFLSKYCRNIETLSFRYEPNRPLEKLIVPSFPELKNLQCDAQVTDTDYCVELELSEMLKLEVLGVRDFHAIIEMTGSMMFDNVKFPNLREVDTSDTFFDPSENFERIMEIAKENNLDFLFE